MIMYAHLTHHIVLYVGFCVVYSKLAIILRTQRTEITNQLLVIIIPWGSKGYRYNNNIMQMWLCLLDLSKCQYYYYWSVFLHHVFVIVCVSNCVFVCFTRPHHIITYCLLYHYNMPTWHYLFSIRHFGTIKFKTKHIQLSHTACW